tara:strand:- start:1190 stop:1840 length:651 start_codon:yes stop_codon:yes gene_type:complete
MWEDVLKVQIVGSKQKVKMGNIPIPTEDEDDCKRWLKGLYDVFKNNENESIGWSANPVFKSERIPEEESCAIKHYIENQPADKIDSYKHNYEQIRYYRYKNKINRMGSDFYTSVVLRFDEAIIMLVGMGNGDEGEQDLKMNLMSSWPDLLEELTRWFYIGDRNKAPMIGSVKEICKYINRKDVWELFKKELAGHLPTDNEGMEIIAKMHQQGELDW